MKLKDYVTLGNLLGGFGSVIALMHDQFDWACYLIYIAYAFDVLDGPVARLTKQYDTFGSHLDTASDYITNSVSTSFIVYYAYIHHAGYPVWLALIIGSLPITFGTIRQARSYDQNLSVPCYWLGLPRPVTGLLFVALLNSSLRELSVAPWKDIAYGVAAVWIAVFCYLHLSYIPFAGHHGRRFFGWMKIGKIWFLIGSPVFLVASWIFLGEPNYFFDYITFSVSVYALFSWILIPKADLKAIKAYVAGGPKVFPLVHKNSAWRAKSAAPYFEDTESWVEPESSVFPTK